MPKSTWTIHSVTGGPDGGSLSSFHITQDGTTYDFTTSNPNTVLSTINLPTFPTGGFDFPSFDYGVAGRNQITWNIHVTTLTGGTGNNQASGTWSNNDPTAEETGIENGDWTAQAGSGADDDEIVSSAKA